MIFVALSTCANVAEYGLSQRSGFAVLNSQDFRCHRRSRDAALHPGKGGFLRLRRTAGAEALGPDSRPRACGKPYPQGQWDLSLETIRVRNSSIWFAGSTDPDQSGSDCAGGRSIGCERVSCCGSRQLRPNGRETEKEHPSV